LRCVEGREEGEEKASRLEDLPEGDSSDLLTKIKEGTSASQKKE
jgi:hypothetical protein